MKAILYLLWICLWLFIAIATGLKAANDVIALVIVCLLPLAVSGVIRRRKRKMQSDNILPANTSPKEDAYITDGNITRRTDGKPISNEEVPYLIQAGLENALCREQESTNPKFHRTFREQDLSFEFSMKHGDEADKRTDKFVTLYQTALQEKDLLKRIDLLNEAVIAFDKAKRFCYSKGKGGTLYFQDTWEYMHNSERPCYSYLDRITGDLDIALQERDIFTPAVFNVISEHDGILQKDIYYKLPDIEKSAIQRIIRRLESENKLERIKKSGSYELHIIEQ